MAKPSGKQTDSVALPSLPESARLLSPATWSVGVGFACLLFWLKAAFLGTSQTAVPILAPIGGLSFAVSLVATVATLFVLGRFHIPCSKVLGKAATRVVTPAVAAAGTVLMTFGGEGPLGAVASVVGGIATGVSTGCLNVIYGIIISLMSTRHTLAVCAIGYLSAAVMDVLVPMFGNGALVACGSLAPVAGMLLMGYGIKCFDFTDNEELDPLPPQVDPRTVAGREDERLIVVRFSALLAVVGSVYLFTRAIYTQLGAVLPAASPNEVVPSLTALVLTVLTILVFSLALKRRGLPAYMTFYKLVTVLLLMNGILLVAPLIFSSVSPGSVLGVALGVNTASFDLLGLMMWVLISGVCKQHPQTSFRTIALVRCAWSAGPLVGGLSGLALCAVVELDLPNLFVALVVCACAVLLACLFIFTEDVVNRALNIIPFEARRRFMDRCQAVAREYGLSEREAEIMALFAKGRNLPYIQEELSLSKGTVSTHRQHIYQKLDVHSSQEMIDLIQNHRI